MLYEQSHLDEPSNSKHNNSFITKTPLKFVSLGDDTCSKNGKPRSVVYAGKDTLFEKQSS